MKFIVISPSKKEFEVEILSQKMVSINSVPIPVELLSKRENLALVKIHQTIYPVLWERKDQHYTIHINGKRLVFEVQTPYVLKRREVLGKQEAYEIVKAPIPGKISAIVVEEGQLVEEGEVLLLLEAMKMQNEIRSPRRGKVREILITEEEQVSLNQELVILE
ncbi:MAG: biotin/lipoyl-containing protein [bacterium JZ-2024 1]